MILVSSAHASWTIGVIAGVLPAKDFIRVMGPRYNNANLVGLITSILVLGCFFGMIPVAYMADRFGRRKTIMSGAAIYVLGGALQTGAQNMNMMLAGRFFAGFGIGIMSDLAPLYQAEIAHPSIRGRLTTLQQFMLGIGAFVASWITYGTSAGLKGLPSEWRVPLGIQIIPAIPLFSFMLLLPESPRWLAAKGRMDEAQATLARLHAHGDVADPFVVSQMDDIKASLELSKDDASWKELFVVPSNFRRLALGYILQFSVQMTGVSAIQYYSTTIFVTMGFTSSRILLFQSINSVIALIGEACCVIYIDRTGRRMPLIIGNVVSGLSFVVGAILMARYPGTVHNALFIWAFYPETTGRRLEEMDALFTDAPIFVPGTKYAKVEDYRAAERELREGTFVPGHLTEEGGIVQDEEGKFSGAGETKHIESTEKI
ncbi:hypothetical protein HWV62_31491 [Athelia sp. TMB]|nr:hypothetical protein HWV62_31491 [Athelia sp. TMB]